MKKWRGWKEGVLSEDLKSIGGGYLHKKGDVVRYRKKKVYGENMCWYGKYEYHYLDLNNYNLVRTSEFLIIDDHQVE